MTGGLLLKLLGTAIGGALAIATAPLVAELLLLTAASKLPSRKIASATAAGGTQPVLRKTTVVVPAHNEGALVARCVHSLRQDAPPGFEVLVIAHNCTDATEDYAREAGASVLTLDDPSSSGKGHALLAGFQAALSRGAEALVVVDADSVVSPGFGRIVQKSLSERVEALQCRYTVRNGGAHSRTMITALGFSGFNVLRPRGRERLGLSAGIFGNGFGFQREVLRRVPYSAMSVVEDLEYHLQLVRAGIRVRFLEDATVESEMPAGGEGRASQRARWEGGRFRMMRSWTPTLLGDLLRGRLRSLEPLLDLLCLPLALGVASLLTSTVLVARFPMPWLQLYLLLAFGVIAVHGVAAAAEGGGLLLGLHTLASVPGYIFWKLCLLPRTLLAARGDATWVRTAREGDDLAGPFPASYLSRKEAARELVGEL